MLLQKRFWAGIQSGEVTLTCRRWKRPKVVAGRVYRTAAGRLEVVAVDVVDPLSISDEDARRSGHESADALRADLPGEKASPTYRIGFRHLDEPDPRDELANQADLTDEDIESLTVRLDRLDRASRLGPWTRQVLALIADHPHRRAPDLAELIERETRSFKTDVRKLEDLGLTLSRNPGYSLSPRGRAFMARTGGAGEG